jgi:hypothetical protein
LKGEKKKKKAETQNNQQYQHPPPSPLFVVCGGGDVQLWCVCFFFLTPLHTQEEKEVNVERHSNSSID